MLGRAVSLVVCVLLVPGAGRAVAQEPPAFPSGAEVVVLDLVTTDRKDRPVDDLRRDEVQVSEDGKACEILAFRLVRAPAAPPSPAAPGRTPAAPPAAREAAATPVRPGLVVLLFDRLTTPARFSPARARSTCSRATSPPTPGSRCSRSATACACWRRSPRIARRSSARSSWPRPATRTSRPCPRVRGPSRPRRYRRRRAVPGSPAAIEVPGAEEAASRLEQIEWGQFVGGQGLDSLHAVLGVSRALASVAGRKAIVYFAEGWQLPVDTYPQVRQAYDEAISAANRANVAVNTVDARGLTSHKAMGLTRHRLRARRVHGRQPRGPGPGRVHALRRRGREWRHERWADRRLHRRCACRAR